MIKDNGINLIRYEMICNSAKPHEIGPPKDPLFQHTMRANYQCLIWNKAQDSHYVLHGQSKIHGK